MIESVGSDEAETWQTALRHMVDSFWNDHRRALGLTSVPALLAEKGYSAASILAGRRWLATLQTDASLDVLPVSNGATPPAWGLIPVGKETEFAENPVFGYLSGGVTPSTKRVAALDPNAPWKLDENGEITPKQMPAPKMVSELDTSSEQIGNTSSKQRRYATINHPTIEALVNERWFFKTEEKAKERIRILRQHFVFSRGFDDTSPDDNILWIKGFALTDADKEDGYWGHFANIVIRTKKSGFSLAPIKLDRHLKSHPQKARHKSKHANWGHPLLRRIKKGGDAATHETLGEAQFWLDSFHEEFPETTIPGEGRLFAHIFVREGGDIGGGHIQKIVLKIQDDVSGRYRLYWHPNYGGLRKAAQTNSEQDAAPAVDIDEESDAKLDHRSFPKTDVKKIIDDLLGDD